MRVLGIHVLTGQLRVPCWTGQKVPRGESWGLELSVSSTPPSIMLFFRRVEL